MVHNRRRGYWTNVDSTTTVTSLRHLWRNKLRARATKGVTYPAVARTMDLRDSFYVVAEDTAEEDLWTKAGR